MLPQTKQRDATPNEVTWPSALVDLHLPTAGLGRYKSSSQRARVGTESWGASNFFCPVCDSPRLDVAPHGTATLDYSCPRCDSPFQLKSQSRPFGTRIVDSAYSQMRRAILTDHTPNLYVLHYDLTAWAVRTVILIPHFAFALSAIERRKPLAPTARRAGWVGLPAPPPRGGPDPECRAHDPQSRRGSGGSAEKSDAAEPEAERREQRQLPQQIQADNVRLGVARGAQPQ